MKKKILFVNDEMVVGGVSRVLNNLLTLIDKEKYNIDLLVLHKHGDMLKDIPQDIKVIGGTNFFDTVDLPISECIKSKKLFKKLYLVFLIKTGLITNKIIKERNKMNLTDYDVEIAFKEGFCSIFTASGNSKRKINWIHADYKIKNYSANYMNIMPSILNKFNNHVAVSKVAAKSYAEVFNLDNVQVIHNIILQTPILEKLKESIEYRDDNFSFISVGRLHPQKGYDRLIKAHYTLINEGYQFKTYIIGDGELYEDLSSMIYDDSFVLLGQQNNPFKYLKQADCFVLSSVYEGLPTVVFEAFMSHLPVLATKVAGVDEQINDTNGYIVENSFEGIYNGMKYVLNHTDDIKNKKEYLGNYNFNNQEILDQIYRLLD